MGYIDTSRDISSLDSRHRRKAPVEDAPDVPPAALFVPICGIASGILVALLGFGLISVMLWLFLFGPSIGVLLLAWGAYKDRLW